MTLPLLAIGSPQPNAVVNPALRPVPLILSVSIDGKQVSTGTVFQKYQNNIIYVPLSSLRRWHIRKPIGNPREIDGKAYYALSQIGVTKSHIDFQNQSISLSIPGTFFQETTLSLNQMQRNKIISPPAFGAFINYDVYGQHSTGSNQEGGYFQVGVFSPLGVFTNSEVVQEGLGVHQTIRLNSTWTSNFPNSMTSLNIGDYINASSVSGNAVRMAGVQYGTNFSLQPYLVTTPLYAVHGVATLPSVVDVYVNNVLLSKQNVPTGPFVLQNLPIITGGGEISTVVTNMLGQQQVITQPFFQSVNLLRPGLSNYSVAIGAIRQNYGLVSNDYGSLAATAGYQKGFSRHFTGGIQTDLQASRVSLGVSGTWAILPIGIFSGALECSNSLHPNQQGCLTTLGFQRFTTTGFSFGANYQFNTNGFTSLGYSEGDPLLERQWNGTLSYGIKRFGSISASYIEQEYYEESATRIAQLNYSLGLGRFGYLTLTALHTFGTGRQSELDAFWTTPFGSSSNASLSSQTGGTASPGTLLTATLQQNLPIGEGYGYLAQLSSNHQAYLQGQYRGPYGTYTAQYQSEGDGENSYRLDASGGIGIIGGVPFLSRTISNSFALVQIPNISGVEVYENNNPIGKTNADGNLIVSQLQPYQHNIISISAQDLPLDATLPALSYPLSPAYLSGSILRFPIHVTRSATFTLLQQNGKPVPAGASLHLQNQKVSFPVGFGGRSYLSGLSVHNHVLATWPTGACVFSLADHHQKNPLPDLGTIICHSVREPHP